MERKVPRKDYTSWKKSFFEALEETRGMNPALLSLIDCLGNDGRQELALSVFNFLNTGAFRNFGDETRKAKIQVTKGVKRVLKNVRKVIGPYDEFVHFLPGSRTEYSVQAGFLPDVT